MAKAASLADTLYDKLKTEIIDGTIPPGSRLPSQKDIATTQEVSRTVVREAVARLEAQGFAESRQGSGVYVAPGARYRAFQVTREELGELSDILKLLEMRLAIEAEMAGLAAARRDQPDIDAMRAALRQMAEVSHDPAASALADAQFHLAIARATKNDYFARFIDFLGVRLVPPRNLYLRDQPGEAHDEYVAKVRAEHDAILAAIVRMDITGAREAARHHMTESLSRHSELSGDLPVG
ncbi:GntR family transcriptional regulator [Croceibacterium mercuriale]|uniref:GntR family transcriptional regulator n=1 Tax=Croceibacterium mercuriale TaxID=1572751 RepID=A0A0B2BSI9_9SPHN|nr:FadR/GntR family transcriptional regulator [Croceibacterium mercuriale]KHL24389.1 GntR family transcriptional regulator [Croceibacterium mercuriale]